MSSGTKISLAVTVLLIGVLAVYYGVSTGEGDGLSPASANGAAGDQSPAPAVAKTPERHAPARSRRPTDGLLSESVERAAERAGSSAGDLTTPASADPGAAMRSPSSQPPVLQPRGPLADRSGAAPATASGDQAGAMEQATSGTIDSDKGSVVMPGSAPPVHPDAAPPATGDPTPALAINSPAANQPASLTGAPPKLVNSPQPSSSPSSSSLAPPRTTEYVIRENDSLWTIALEWFGDGTKWDLIARANPLVDPDQMTVGQRINLPAKDATREPPPAAPARPGASAAAAASGTTHVVASGDTLAKLARAYYGNVARWTLIYEANRAVIGADPGALRVGMKLAIPPASRPAAKAPSA